MYTKVSSFQGVGIEGYSVYRGVLVSGGCNRGFHCILILGGWNRGLQCIQRCPCFRGL